MAGIDRDRLLRAGHHVKEGVVLRVWGLGFRV